MDFTLIQLIQGYEFYTYTIYLKSFPLFKRQNGQSIMLPPVPFDLLPLRLPCPRSRQISREASHMPYPTGLPRHHSIVLSHLL